MHVDEHEGVEDPGQTAREHRLPGARGAAEQDLGSVTPASEPAVPSYIGGVDRATDYESPLGSTPLTCVNAERPHLQCQAEADQSGPEMTHTDPKRGTKVQHGSMRA